MDSSPLPTSPPPSSAAFAVLTSCTLLPLIGQFQNGVPLLILELLPVFDERFPAIWKKNILFVNKIGRYWASALFCGDLASVQLLCRMRHWPRFANDESNMSMKDVPKYAAMIGRLDVLQWLHENEAIAPASWNGSILNEALVNKHHDVAHWWVLNRRDACRTDIDTSAMSILLNRLELVRDFLAFCSEASTLSVMDEAFRRQNLEVISYLHEHSPAVFSPRAMDLAAIFGHLDVIKFLHANRTEGCTTKAMDYAADYNHFDLLLFLHENRAEGCTTDAMKSAAQHGRLDIVQLLLENRKEGLQAMDDAAKNGHLDVVGFLHDNRTEGCTTSAMDGAAEYGHLHIVRFLHERRTEGCTDAMHRAARNGHLAVIQYLHENRPVSPCTESAITWAALGGHVEVLQFLHENRGIQASDWLINCVLPDRKFAAVRYLHETMNTPFDKTSVELAARLQDDQMFEYITSRLPEGVAPVERRAPIAPHTAFCFTDSDY